MTAIRDQLYVDPERHEEFRRMIESKGRVEGFQAEQRRKGDGTFWTSINARVSTVKPAEFLYYEGTCEDNTTRRVNGGIAPQGAGDLPGNP